MQPLAAALTPSIAQVLHLFSMLAILIPAAPTISVENRLGLPSLPAQEALQGLSTHSQTQLHQVSQVHTALLLQPY